MVKSIAVSTGKVRRFPWEELCYGAKAFIPGVPEAVNLPETLVAPLRTFREGVFHHLGDDTAGWTIQDFIKCLKKKENHTFFRNDKTWVLDWTFLKDHVDIMLTERIHNEAIACFSSPDKCADLSINSVAAKIEKLKSRPETLALPFAFTRDLTGPIGFLLNLHEGVHPDGKGFSHMYPLSSSCCQISRELRPAEGGGLAEAWIQVPRSSYVVWATCARVQVRGN